MVTFVTFAPLQNRYLSKNRRNDDENGCRFTEICPVSFANSLSLLYSINLFVGGDTMAILLILALLILLTEPNNNRDSANLEDVWKDLE
jgi:hypothetical protein